MNRCLNKVMVIGWLGGDPETRHTTSGRAVTTFPVFTTHSWHSTQGQAYEETEWFNVVAWGDLAVFSDNDLRKGHRIYLEGRLQTRGWEDSEGQKRFRTEVVAQELILLSEPQSDVSN